MSREYMIRLKGRPSGFKVRTISVEGTIEQGGALGIAQASHVTRSMWSLLYKSILTHFRDEAQPQTQHR